MCGLRGESTQVVESDKTNDRIGRVLVLKQTLAKLARTAVHQTAVGEMSNHRAAARMCLQTGWPLDPCTMDENGRQWCFTKPEMRNKAARKLIVGKPFPVVGGPPCTDRSTMMNLNRGKIGSEVVEECKRIARAP